MEVIPTSLPLNQTAKIVRMNCTEMNQRDMVDYLHLLGHQPKKIRNYDYLVSVTTKNFK